MQNTRGATNDEDLVLLLYPACEDKIESEICKCIRKKYVG